MIKELIALANHLDGKGLTREADIVDNLIKSAGELEDDMAKEIDLLMRGKPAWEPDAPKPTLAPIEEPDMDHPVFNSGERKECKEIGDAILALVGTGNDMDAFYPAAANLINTIKKLYNHPELDYFHVPPRNYIKDSHMFASKGSEYVRKYNDDGSEKTFEEYLDYKGHKGADSMMYDIDGLIYHVAECNHLNLVHSIKVSLNNDLGIDKSCIDSFLPEVIIRCGVDPSEAEKMSKRFDNLYSKDWMSNYLKELES